jgi:hypothetical protein
MKEVEAHRRGDFPARCPDGRRWRISGGRRHRGSCGRGTEEDGELVCLVGIENCVLEKQ